MNIAIIGGGAAGMACAIKAAENGNRVTLFERNAKLGMKLYITGKGRCNLTNDTNRDGFFDNVVHNPRFLYSAYSAGCPADVMRGFESMGVPLKVERGNRVFPVSDKSSDVIRALSRRMDELGVKVLLNTRIEGVAVSGGAVVGVTVSGKTLPFDAAVLATGGVSYPSTGSTGDGLRFAEELGLAVTPTQGSLVPLETRESWCGTLSGVSLKNVTLTLKRKGKALYSELGEMLFTHFGVSGPLVLTASAYMDDDASYELFIDLKPALSAETLDARLVRDIAASNKKTVGGAFFGLLPARLLDVVLELAAVDAHAPAASFTRAQRMSLVQTLKGVCLHIERKRPVDEAIITRGGVKVSEIDPSTMEAKRVKGLYFAGEMIDVDAFTGGFNLQIAWSTGVLAGRSIE